MELLKKLFLLLLLYKKNFYPKYKWNTNINEIQQNEIQNKIERVRGEINLLQDRLEKNEKSQNQFQNGLMRVKRNTIKKKTK